MTEIQKIPDGSVDVVVTSPPYNLGVAYSTYVDRVPRDAYLAWLRDVGVQLLRVLKRDGSFFLNVGSTNTDPWLYMDVANVYRSLFTLQNHIVWAKSLTVNGNSIGHFKPITSKRFLNQNHESIFHFTKVGNIKIDRLAIGVPYKDKTNIKRRGHAQDMRCGGNVWHIPYETAQNKADKHFHPAGYPLELPRRCIMMHGGANLTVLDPFMGTGTTLVAADQLNHYGVGIELDADYAQTAVKRLNL